MNKKTKVWMSLGLVAALATAAGTAMAATAQKPATTVEHRFHGQHDFGLKGFGNNSSLLNLLKTDKNTLEKELESGKSLADVAAEKGVSKQQVVDLLTKLRTQQIDQLVKDDKLTQAKADQIKSKLNDQVIKLVDHKGGFEGHKGDNRLENVASVLGMTQQDLINQLKTGKSIADVAKAKGLSEQQVIDALLQKDKQAITQFVEKKNWEAKHHENPDETGDNGSQAAN
jgi:predicted DNA-binding protein YlxM (UPF0122 family)/lambda repressor-like predicted transcriptional regulator